MVLEGILQAGDKCDFLQESYIFNGIAFIIVMDKVCRWKQGSVDLYHDW